jgi:hypothetical protein
LATVIPAMDHTEEVLADVAKDECYDLVIREAIGLARRTLNQYYSLTDSSEVSRTMMGAYVLLDVNIY